MSKLKNVILMVVVALLMINPVPSKAYVFAIPAIMEGTIALASSAEVAYATLGGGALAVAGRQSVKQGSKYVVKKSIDSYIKPLLMKRLVRSFGANKEILKNIKFAKIIFNASYVPKTGKQLLYYISLEHGGKNYYKIGITKKSLKQRYRREYHSASMNPILMLEMPIKSALGVETAIKSAFFSNRANNRAILAKDGGYSEVYKRDILKIDNIMLSVIKWIE